MDGVKISRLRMFSHLSVCEHCNRAQTRTKNYFALRSPERGGLSPISNELWGGSLEIRPNGPNDIMIHNGKCVI